MSENWDIALVTTLAVALNMLQSRQRPYWHVYQVAVMLIMGYHVYGTTERGWPPLLDVIADQTGVNLTASFAVACASPFAIK